MSFNSRPIQTSAWSAWFLYDGRPYLVDTSGRTAIEAPDISFLPIVMRKRLSLQSKIGLWLADHTVRQTSYARQSLASVFATRYGEYQRTYSILDGICKGEPPSPAAFSQSVHNTTSGLWSIAAECMAPSTTIAAGNATLHTGLLEAANISTEITAPVLYVYSDVPLPDRYGDRDRVGSAVGFAAIIEPETPKTTKTPSVSYVLRWGQQSEDQSALSATQQVAEITHLLVGEASRTRVSNGRMMWELALA